MIDYLVVGLGLAGISFCEQLERHGKTYHVISDNSQTSSSVAGGLYNPIIVKRFTLAWKASEQLRKAKDFYGGLESKLKVKMDYKLPILRRFTSVEEQNLWFEASDKVGLKNFLSPEIQENTNPSIDAPLGFGEVLHTGRIDTSLLINKYADLIRQRGNLSSANFVYNKLKITESYVQYGKIKAHKVVFSEGFGLTKNPFFNYLPMNGTKGEYVIVEAPNLKERRAIKSTVFCIPLGNDQYKIGANYDREDKSNTISLETRHMLLEKLNTFIKCDFKVVGQLAGVRPTVMDRRPLVGRHPNFKNLYVLNGFGSRGVLIAPYVAGQLFQHIETGQELDEEINIKRFAKRYRPS